MVSRIYAYSIWKFLCSPVYDDKVEQAAGQLLSTVSLFQDMGNPKLDFSIHMATLHPVLARGTA